MTLSATTAVGSLLASHAAGKVLDAVANQLRAGILGKVAQRRGERFFATFCNEVAELSGLVATDEESQRYLNERVEELLASDESREALYDACRAVTLCRSHKLGPRLVALITARIVSEERQADEEEADMLSLSETLTDHELQQFSDLVTKHEALLTSGTKCGTTENGDELWIEGPDETIDSNWGGGDYELRSSPVEADEWFGRWVARPQVLGLVRVEVWDKQRAYAADYEYIDEPGTVRRISHVFVVPGWARRYGALISRARVV